MNLFFSRLAAIAIPLTFSAVLAFAPPAGAALVDNAVAPNGLSTNGLNLQGLSTNGMSPQGVRLNGLSTNALIDNGVKFNALAQTGMSSNSTTLDQLNGVMVEAVILPERFDR